MRVCCSRGTRAAPARRRGGRRHRSRAPRPLRGHRLRGAVRALNSNTCGSFNLASAGSCGALHSLCSRRGPREAAQKAAHKAHHGASRPRGDADHTARTPEKSGLDAKREEVQHARQKAHAHGACVPVRVAARMLRTRARMHMHMFRFMWLPICCVHAHECICMCASGGF